MRSAVTAGCGSLPLCASSCKRRPRAALRVRSPAIGRTPSSRRKDCDGNKGDGRSLTIWAQTPRHIPHCLRDHRDRHQFQAVDQALPRSTAQVWSDLSKADKQEKGWQCEATPRGQTAEPSRSHKPDRNPQPGCWQGRGETGTALPGRCRPHHRANASFDKLTTEIAEMSDRPAK
jgi:hypothetical protein